MFAASRPCLGRLQRTQGTHEARLISQASDRCPPRMSQKKQLRGQDCGFAECNAASQPLRLRWLGTETSTPTTPPSQNPTSIIAGAVHAPHMQRCCLRGSHLQREVGGSPTLDTSELHFSCLGRECLEDGTLSLDDGEVQLQSVDAILSSRGFCQDKASFWLCDLGLAVDSQSWTGEERMTQVFIW